MRFTVSLFSLSELSIPITLTAEPDTVPSAPSYNTYSLTCEANPPDFLNYPFEFQWIRIAGSDSEEIITPDSSTTIETSATEPVSILRTSQMIPGQYEYYCTVQFLYGDEVVASDTSISITVTVTGNVVFNTPHTVLADSEAHHSEVVVRINIMLQTFFVMLRTVMC